MLQQIVKIADSLGVFVRVFGEMDVKAEEMNGVLQNVYASSTDNNEVANLLNEIRDQQQMQVGGRDRSR